jgi:hypothetical protein
MLYILGYCKLYHINYIYSSFDEAGSNLEYCSVFILVNKYRRVYLAPKSRWVGG